MADDGLREAIADIFLTSRQTVVEDLPVGPLDWADEVLRVLRERRVDPNLLRWCDWPGCLNHYDAIATRGLSGWLQQRRHLSVLLCPEHAPLDHWPRWEKADGDWSTLTATCTCGAREVVTPSNHDAVLAWWAGHLAQLGLTRPGCVSE